MINKNEVKYIQSLSQKKHRLQEGLFIAEGVKLVEEIIQSQYTVKKIYATEKWLIGRGGDGQAVTVVSEAELARISTLQTPNQVLALVQQPTIQAQIEFKNKLSLVLDGIQDPGNLGTIIRIADWFGIKQIICSPDTVELYNPKVIQSTMGSFLRVHIIYTDLKEVLAKAGVPILGALLNGESIYTFPPIDEAILMIGSEGKGISDDLLPFITKPVTIPKMGGAESLNAAVATGILISHLVVSRKS
ncbi:TrmH family RNA methyltransferase [Parasediminibacterium sp. JCM 36343]|uniref:TrmH family RNA methyltransferase n=1 Tax=Parasediminibacterium sp. JCM 36343 TaxID=3374279 RepID=UPI0039785737